jgi:hypothetical protein
LVRYWTGLDTSRERATKPAAENMPIPKIAVTFAPLDAHLQSQQTA